MCFTLGLGMLIFTIFGIIDSLVSIKIVDNGFFLGVIYIIWAIGQFFDKKKMTSYIKALISYFFGLITYTLSILLISLLVDKSSN